MRSGRILLPRVFLRRWLDRCEGAPLTRRVRDFMEARFGTSFGDVRIHTGPAASRLCLMLQGRALTLGSDIVFGDGQYAPETREGRHQLARQLVHVLQQRAAPAPAWCVSPQAFSRLVGLGDPHDSCELEADRLADEVMAGGLRSVITPDASGLLRRSL